jgi:AcrR family transcriptional regulator
MTESPATKKTGRPRSEESRAAILETTWDLLQTNCVKHLSIEAIAREAGVGKTTIYRWWPTKTAVVMDALIEKLLPETAFPEVNSVTEAITLQMQSLVAAFSGIYGRIVGQIIAEGQACSDTLASYRERFLYPRREAAKELILKGIALGEFDPDLDPELALDILYGPVYFRLLVGHLPLNAAFAEQLPQQVLKALRANPLVGAHPVQD